MIRRYAFRTLLWVGAGVLASGLAACSQQEQPAAGPQPQVEEKTFTVTPPPLP